MPSVSFSIASSSARSNSAAEIGGRCCAWEAAAGFPVVAEVEDRALAELRVLLRLLPRRLGGRQRLQHSLAGRPGRVERAALDQAFDRPFVDGAGVDPLAEVPDRGDRPILARPQDRLDRRMADVLDRVEAEADRVLGDDEAVVGGVDVGRQHLDPHLLAAVDEERHLVFGVHHRGDHRRHVLGRVVGLQIGGAVGDQPVAGGVGLVERVVGRRFVQLPEVRGDVRRGPRLLQAGHELVLHRRHQVALLLADRLAQVVRLGPRRSPPSSGRSPSAAPGR